MPDACSEIDTLLAQDFVERRPNEVAEHLEDMALQEAADVVASIDPRVLAKAFRTLSLAKALDILESAEPLACGALLLNLAPARAGAVLEGLTEAKREEILERMSQADARELRVLATYQPDSAGRLRDPGIAVFRTTTSVADALARLKSVHRGRSLLNLFVVDDDGGLVGTVPLHEALVADPGDSLLSLVRQPPLAVSPFASRSEIVETMRRHRLASLPVVGPQNTPIGVLRLDELIEEVEKELSSDLLSMTGASKEESALSGPGFAVRKRLPWLQVNLATAFLAAAVVGLFEDTIARFTALAVLLPVVAGQSGNTGSQALAVVLRGLAVREITRRQLPTVALKELFAGALNGVGVAVVACAGVYLWSSSMGLVLVIGMAMILAMAIAGVAGAVIPILLDSLGQDPAQSSSIILTTVTDVFGFMSFLGLATVFSSLI
ncbi:MAG: magnesium transporter [Bryobacterales bacterium]|nr:magnesium transporter [Bryobacterales bacterium]MDE0296520.1 magnesium transporter [Bryobacterales bacterium]